MHVWNESLRFFKLFSNGMREVLSFSMQNFSFSLFKLLLITWRQNIVKRFFPKFCLVFRYFFEFLKVLKHFFLLKLLCQLFVAFAVNSEQKTHLNLKILREQESQFSKGNFFAKKNREEGRYAQYYFTTNQR